MRSCLEGANSNKRVEESRFWSGPADSDTGAPRTFQASRATTGPLCSMRRCLPPHGVLAGVMTSHAWTLGQAAFLHPRASLKVLFSPHSYGGVPTEVT
eukprot:2792801-Amphidinium_carterae.1